MIVCDDVSDISSYHKNFHSLQIPEYCRTLDEKDIVDNAFNLIFAFDEIIALGYRESVNLAQIKTFVEMDSHEEKVFQAVRETQEKEAKQKMREKAKDLQRQRMESQKKGGIPSRFGGSGGGDNFGMSSSSMSSSSPSISSMDIKPAAPIASKPSAPKNAMKLGGKTRDVDQFVDQLKSEGEKVSNLTPTNVSSAAAVAARPKSDVPTDE